MATLFRTVYEWLMRTFWATEMDVTLVGLQNAGKTSLLRVLAGGEFTIEPMIPLTLYTIPTVGFNLKKLKRGHVTLKCWDIGGQPRFRAMWERYCRDVSAIVYIVDIADTDQMELARNELHSLMEQPTLTGIPLLVLGNKSDLAGRITVDQLIEDMQLSRITNREVSCYGISVKEETNLKAVIEWLLKWSR